MTQRMDGPLVVGFGHRRRVGKDTLAGMVRDELAKAGVSVFRDAFAWKLKDVAQKLFGYAGLGYGDLYDQEPERREAVLPAIGLSPRELWIALGQKMREIVPDVWLRNVLDNPAYGPGCVLILSDVRYPNEVDAIRARGGMVLKVSRLGVAESDDAADSALAHVPDDGWDRIVHNHGDLARLAEVAREVAWIIRQRLHAGGGHHGTAGLPA